MISNGEHIAFLIKKYLDGDLSLPETEELNSWLAADTLNEEQFNQLTSPASFYDNLRAFHYSDLSGIRENLKQRFRLLEDEPQPAVARHAHILKSPWIRYAAAILLIITSIAVYYNFSRISRPAPAVVKKLSAATADDIMPGFNRAVLTLSNGRKIELDSATSETITDGTLSIENINGGLRYGLGAGTSFAADTSPLRSPSKDGAKRPVAYNTMVTPKGGQYKLALADGTKVWLNAASSITYPTTFNQKTREVVVTGEVYFEVAKNKEKPFIVTVGQVITSAGIGGLDGKTITYQIEVLGTSFNVNSYSNEIPKTSLVEGSIKINNNILQPGQAYTNGKVMVTNAEQDIAWKNGLFYFSDAGLPAIMRQLERWYDIEVEYSTKIPKQQFSGKFQRKLKLPEILEALAMMQVKFEMKEKTLYVR